MTAPLVYIISILFDGKRKNTIKSLFTAFKSPSSSKLLTSPKASKPLPTTPYTDPTAPTDEISSDEYEKIESAPVHKPSKIHPAKHRQLKEKLVIGTIKADPKPRVPVRSPTIRSKDNRSLIRRASTRPPPLPPTPPSGDTAGCVQPQKDGPALTSSNQDKVKTGRRKLNKNEMHLDRQNANNSSSEMNNDTYSKCGTQKMYSRKYYTPLALPRVNNGDTTQNSTDQHDQSSPVAAAAHEMLATASSAPAAHEVLAAASSALWPSTDYSSQPQHNPNSSIIKTLSSDELTECLKTLKLAKYARLFTENDIDGEFLASLTDKSDMVDMLKTDFNMMGFEAHKLWIFIHKGWVPK